MLDRALQQRAIWINDVSLAFVGGEERLARVKMLVQAVEAKPAAPSKAEAAEFLSLIPIEQQRARKKREAYLKACEQAGIKP